MSRYQRANKPASNGDIVMLPDVSPPVALSPRQEAKVSLPLLRAINDSKIKVADTRMAHAFQTGYPTISDCGTPAGKEAMERAQEMLLQQQSMRFGVDSARKRKYEMCGKLTTSRYAYTNLLEGEDGVARLASGDSPRLSPRSHLVGRSMKPEVFHELPYGSECPMMIGDKTSVYRSSFPGTEDNGKRSLVVRNDGLNSGTAAVSPRSVVLRKVHPPHVPLSPPSPRSEASAGHHVTTFSSTSGNGTSRAQIASDAQARRELSCLTQSARSHSQRAANLQATTTYGR